MALTADIVLRGGVPVQGAYVRVVSTRVDREAMPPDGAVEYRLCFARETFLNADAAEANQPLEEWAYHTAPYDLDGANTLTQAYDWLKANVFPDAVDA